MVKNSPTNAGGVKRHLSQDPWVRKIPWRRAGQPTPVFLPAESHGQGSLAGCSPWGHRESDMAETVWHDTRSVCFVHGAFTELWLFFFFFNVD